MDEFHLERWYQPRSYNATWGVGLCQGSRGICHLLYIDQQRRRLLVLLCARPCWIIMHSVKGAHKYVALEQNMHVCAGGDSCVYTRRAGGVSHTIPTNVYNLVCVSHSTGVYSRVCLTVPMYTTECVSQYRCIQPSVSHSTGVYNRVCLTVLVYTAECVSQYWCIQPSVSHSTCVYNRVCLTVPVYTTECVSQYRCIQPGMCLTVPISTIPYNPDCDVTWLASTTSTSHI